MQDFIFVTGLILKQTPVGEYDRRICLLTKERGKISAFVRGSRKPSGKLAAACNPFSFGRFKLFPGKDSYSVSDAEIQNYFEELRLDFEAACIGMYFCEVADYYSRENSDETELLKLLYQSLRALTIPTLRRELVQLVFEVKAIVVNGEYPGIPTDKEYRDGTKLAFEYIRTSSVEKLYSFAVTDEVFEEMQEVAGSLKKRFLNHSFKSLEVLKTLY